MGGEDGKNVATAAGNSKVRVWALTGGLVSLTVVLATSVVRLGPPSATHFRVAPWALTGLFLVADVLVVHLVVRREGYSFSVSEVPLVIGLFFAPGTTLMVAQLVGSALALLFHRRQVPLKLCFNLACFGAQVCTTALVFHRFADGAELLSLRAVLATMGATAAGLVVATTAVSAAISIYEGALEARKLIVSTTAYFVAGVTNTSIGLVAVVLLAHDPAAMWLLVVPLALLFVAYRSVRVSQEKQEGLEFLYEASRILHRGASLEAPMVELLTLARETFHADVAELTLQASEGGRGLRTTVGPGDHVSSLEPVALLPVGVAPGVMAATLEGERRSLGTILVSGPSRAQGPFSRRHVRLFETFVNHVTAALENGLLEASVAQLTALKEELHHQAFHDELTGLGNRALFISELDRALAECPARDSVAVLFVDLDDFKTVNDTLGHAAGDELLMRTAERLRSCVRPGDLAARLGGDEFAVLLHHLGEDGDAVPVTVAQRLLAALRVPVLTHGEQVQVGASIGMASTASAPCTAGELLRNADVAMYSSKARGKNRWELFEPAMQREVVGRHAAKLHLHRAIERGELVLHYQPLVDLGTGDIVGAEALVRWQHPDRGLLLPADFVPAAEEFALVGDLGRFVLTEACAEARTWPRPHSDGLPLSICVNVSPLELRPADFVAHVAQVVEESGIAPHSLVLEITETAMVEGSAEIADVFRRLRASGVRLAIDDFGTGYSSLSSLDEGVVDILKIAKPFVDRLVTDRPRPLLAKAIVQLGHSLGLDIVAEGVETEKQTATLRAMGCRFGQGHAFGRAMEAAAFRRLLADQTRRTNPSCMTDTTCVPSRV